MPLYNRERDFSCATLQDIREKLQGESDHYNELLRFWDMHGEAFDLIDPRQEMFELESYLSQLRWWMSG